MNQLVVWTKKLQKKFFFVKNTSKSKRLIIFATHNRFFANKSDCLLEMVDGNVKSTNV